MGAWPCPGVEGCRTDRKPGSSRFSRRHCLCKVNAFLEIAFHAPRFLAHIFQGFSRQPWEIKLFSPHC